MPDGPKTFVITYDEAPPSVNHGARRGRHWSVERDRKRKWEGIVGMLLIARKVPRGMMGCTCEGLIEFRTRNRRDAENYRGVLVKALADALVNGGWLKDDTAEFFEFGRLILSAGLDHPNPQVKGRTTIRIEADYPVPV